MLQLSYLLAHAERWRQLQGCTFVQSFLGVGHSKAMHCHPLSGALHQHLHQQPICNRHVSGLERAGPLNVLLFVELYIVNIVE